MGGAGGWGIKRRRDKENCCGCGGAWRGWGGHRAEEDGEEEDCAMLCPVPTAMDPAAPAHRNRTRTAGEKYNLEKGVVVEIPKNTEWAFRGKLKMLEISLPKFNPDTCKYTRKNDL